MRWRKKAASQDAGQAKEKKAALRRIRRARAAELLGRHLDDLLMVSGGACLTAAAALRWGAAAGLAVGGAGLILCAMLVARSGRR